MKRTEELAHLENQEEVRTYQHLQAGIAAVRADILAVARLHALLHEFEVTGGSVDTIQKEDLRHMSTAYFETYEGLERTVHAYLYAKADPMVALDQARRESVEVAGGGSDE